MFTELLIGGAGLEEFNFLVTCRKGDERHAKVEAEEVFRKIGDNAPLVWKTKFSGLLACKSSLDWLEAVKEIRRLIDEDPTTFFLTLRYIPVAKTVRTDLDEIKDAVKDMIDVIGEDESFRVTVEKRGSPLSSRDIILGVAELIDRKVDLKNPDWVVLIEVVGDITGVSVLKPNDVISLTKMR